MAISDLPRFGLVVRGATERAGGALYGTVQVFDGTDLLYERAGNLSSPEHLELVAEEAAQLGLVGADAALQKAVGEARAGIDAGVVENPGSKLVNEKFAGPAAWVISQLAEEGRFIDCSLGRFYFDGETHVITPVDGEPMRFLLRSKFGLNGTDRIAGYIAEELVWPTAIRGESVGLRQFSHYEPGTNVLYVHESAGEVLKLTAEAVERVPNGTDGVMFMPSDMFAPWTYTPSVRKDWTLRDQIIEPISFISGEETPLTEEEQGTMFLFWIVSMFFRSDMPTRPLALAVGETGSGKSVMIRQVGKILFGPTFELDMMNTEREDDFWDVLKGRPFVGWDNLDTGTKWLENALATVATGAQRSKRKLYSDDEVLKHRPDTFLALTARTPRFRRPDVSSRLLIFHLANRQENGLPNAGERLLYERIDLGRDRYMSELVDRVRLTLAVPRQDPADSPLRIADFYAVIYRIGLSVDKADEVAEMAEKMRGVQNDFAAEENILVLTVLAWLDGEHDGRPNWSRTLPSRTLLNELRETAERNGYRLHLSNEVALGKQLIELIEPMRDRGVTMVKSRGRTSQWHIFPAGESDGRML